MNYKYKEFFDYYDSLKEGSMTFTIDVPKEKEEDLKQILKAEIIDGMGGKVSQKLDANKKEAPINMDTSYIEKALAKVDSLFTREIIGKTDLNPGVEIKVAYFSDINGNSELEGEKKVADAIEGTKEWARAGLVLVLTNKIKASTWRSNDFRNGLNDKIEKIQNEKYYITKNKGTDDEIKFYLSFGEPKIKESMDKIIVPVIFAPKLQKFKRTKNFINNIGKTIARDTSKALLKGLGF